MEDRALVAAASVMYQSYVQVQVRERGGTLSRASSSVARSEREIERGRKGGREGGGRKGGREAGREEEGR